VLAQNAILAGGGCIQPVIPKVKEYLAQLSGGPPPRFTYLDMAFVRELEQTGFVLAEHTDITALERLYAGTEVLAHKENRFPAEFVLLRRA
jgi:hypothetical protein